MNIKTNPFFVLNVSCTANRREIAAALEEIDFVVGSDACAEAQGILTNPGKRLAAEIDWFPEASAAILSLIRSYVEKNDVIPTFSLTGISKLNGMLYNLGMSNEKDVGRVCAVIKTLSAQFESISADDLVDRINNIHSVAKIGSVSVVDVERELSKKRDAVRQTVTEHLQSLGDDNYVSCVSQLAVGAADEDFDIVISDVLDQYELWVKSRLEDKQSLIDSKIESIKQNVDSDTLLKKKIHALLQVAKDWNQLAYPMQVVMQKTGIDNLHIGATAIKLRGLSLYLHNEKSKTDAAATLIRELQQLFVNLPDVMTLLKKDSKTLTELQEKNREYERQERENRQADRVYAVDIKGNQCVIPPLCTCCMKPTNNKEKISYSSQTQRGRTTTTRTISIDMPICEECLRHRSKFSGKQFWMGVWSILVGLGIMIVALAGFLIEDMTAACIGGSVAVALFFILAAIKKTKPLSEEHSTRLQSVRMFSLLFPNEVLSNLLNWDSLSTTTYIFTNWKYATLFQEANAKIAGQLRVISEVNSAKRTSVLQIMEHKFANAFKVVAVFGLLAILVSSANSSGVFKDLHLDTMLKDADISISASAKPTAKPTTRATVKPTVKPTAKPTTKPSTSTTSASGYSALSAFGSYVYIDVVSIEPSIGVGSGYGVNTDIVCECKSPSGGKLWVIMPISTYTREIDSTAKLTNSATASFKTVTYSKAARIYGYVRNADSECTGLSKSISTTKVIEFKSIEKQTGLNSNGSVGAVATKAPTKVTATNGKKFITPSYKGVCPFTIFADSTTDYYVYLKYQRAPKSSTESRTLKSGAKFPYEKDVAFYLKAGQRVEIDVPIGVYKLYYATGSDFYGTKLLFGDNTHYYASDDLLSFYSDSQYYNGHTITLKSMYNGNFDTDPISESQFPIR